MRLDEFSIPDGSLSRIDLARMLLFGFDIELAELEISAIYFPVIVLARYVYFDAVELAENVTFPILDLDYSTIFPTEEL